MMEVADELGSFRLIKICDLLGAASSDQSYPQIYRFQLPVTKSTFLN